MLNKNDIITLDITGLSSEGSGIGRAECGLTVFTPLTAVGDRARIRIVKVKKSYAFGRLEEILVPSPDRVTDSCPVFKQCGGCTLRHISYESERALKQNRVFEVIRRIGGVELPPQPILFDNPDRYRNKAQYPISRDGSVGFYAHHSHRIIPCADCLLQPEIFEKISLAVTRWINQNGISVYDETSHSGLLRHLYLRHAEATGEIMVVLVINGQTLPCGDALIATLRELLGARLTSVQLNINTADTNVILGEKCVTIYGADYITDVLYGVRVRLSALSFYQVNRTMAEKIYQKAAEYAEPDGKKILDLYCGAGTIGLSMAHRAESIIGVEIVPQAVEDACHNARENGILNARFMCADAAAAAATLKTECVRPDVVILDPPRKGCSEELLTTVCSGFAPERLVYVSCDSATLARDIAFLTKNGYALKEYTPADLFPRTSHCECVALLCRN